MLNGRPGKWLAMNTNTRILLSLLVLLLGVAAQARPVLDITSADAESHSLPPVTIKAELESPWTVKLFPRESYYFDLSSPPGGPEGVSLGYFPTAGDSPESFRTVGKTAFQKHSAKFNGLGAKCLAEVDSLPSPCVVLLGELPTGGQSNLLAISLPCPGKAEGRLVLLLTMEGERDGMKVLKYPSYAEFLNSVKISGDE
jgi:hypothetical protein